MNGTRGTYVMVSCYNSICLAYDVVLVNHALAERQQSVEYVRKLLVECARHAKAGKETKLKYNPE